MNRVIKKLITAVILTTAACAALGCQAKPIEENFLVYNNTDMIITSVYISPEEIPFDDEDAIKLVDIEYLLPMKQNLTTVIEVPADIHDKELNIFVDGYGSKGMLKTTVSAGKMFADGIWGIEITLSDDGTALEVDLLDDMDI